MKTPCSLCENPDVEVRETIAVSDIIYQYRSQFGIDVSTEFDAVRQLQYIACSRCGLSYFSPAIVGSESFYEAFHRFAWYYPDEKSEFAFACSFIRDGDHVLEIGSGKGAFAKYLPTRKYVGLEYSRSAISIASANNITVLHDSIEAHANENLNAYDVVCCFQVLEHVQDVRSFLSASIAALNEGGLLIYSVPNDDSFIRKANNNILNMPPHHQTRWSHRTLNNLPAFFPLELIQLRNDRLADVHKGWYAATELSSAIRLLFGMKPRLVDVSVFRGILNKSATALGDMYASLFLRSQASLPDGHSVTAVYRKRSSAAAARS